MRLLLAAVLAPAVASASGFYMSENGGKALMMGGAFTGQADDLSALQHNPAGLSQLQGFHFLVDGQLLFHSINFQRYDPGFDPAAPPNTPANSVNNTAPPFLVPMLGLGYGFKLFDRGLFIGAGVYGPPASGRYVFPEPNYTRMGGKLVENARKFAPQRYTLIDNNILVIFPTLSVAYAVHPRFMLGASLQPVLASFYFSQSITSIDRLGIHPTTQAMEDPVYDSLVKVNLPMQYVQFTAVLGALVRPVDWLQIGVSFRPQTMINAKGKLEVIPGPIAQDSNAMVSGDQTTLSLMLPAELKVGVHVQPLSKLGLNFDFVYQGWQSVREIVVSPQGVTLSLMGGAPTPVAQFRIQKNWQAAYGFRLGAAYDLFSFLSLYLGGWYETGAIPDQYIGVDFLHFARLNLTGGLGLKFWGMEVLLGAGGSPTMSHAVTQSEVRAGSTEPEPAPVVGTGVYTSGHFMVSLGIRGRFGGGPTEPAREPAPAAAPAPAPAPAAAPAAETPAGAPTSAQEPAKP